MRWSWLRLVWQPLKHLSSLFPFSFSPYLLKPPLFSFFLFVSLYACISFFVALKFCLMFSLVQMISEFLFLWLVSFCVCFLKCFLKLLFYADASSCIVCPYLLLSSWNETDMPTFLFERKKFQWCPENSTFRAALSILRSSFKKFYFVVCCFFLELFFHKTLN